MNTFIKRSMLLGLSLVFIGAAATPACAQKNNFIRYIKNVFGKKTSLTTPNLPKRATSKLPLNAAVEQKVAQTQSSSSENILKKIQEVNLLALVDKATPATPEGNFYPTSDIAKLITSTTPQFIPIPIHVQIDPEENMEIMGDIQTNSYPMGPRHERLS